MTLVKEEDGGEYEVIAENEIGSVSSKSMVTVHSKYWYKNKIVTKYIFDKSLLSI